MPRRISYRTQASIGLVRNHAATPDEVRDMALHLHRFRILSCVSGKRFCADDRVAGLVYIAALAPDADETSQSRQGKFRVTDVPFGT